MWSSPAGAYPLTTILQIGDVHLSDQAPSGRSDDYQATGLRKLSEVVDYANEVHPDIIVFMGDIFHLKRPSSVSHYLVNSINAVLHHLPTRAYCILGNHDTPTEGKAFKHYPLASLDVNLLLEPLLVKGIYLIPIAGSISKTPEFIRTYVEDAVDKAPTDDHIPVVVAHLSISSTPLPFEYIEPEIFTGLVPIVLFGHLHNRDIFTFDGTLFCNPGALMRTSMSESDFNLEPAVALIDVKTSSVDVHIISHAPPQEVMHLEVRAEVKEEKFARARFIDMLSKANVLTAGVDAIREQIKQAAVKPHIKEVAIDLIDHVA